MMGFFFSFSNRELIIPSQCTRPSLTLSITPPWFSPTASHRPSIRPRSLRPGPTVWPWGWSLGPPWQCQQVRRKTLPWSEPQFHLLAGTYPNRLSRRCVLDEKPSVHPTSLQLAELPRTQLIAVSPAGFAGCLPPFAGKKKSQLVCS